MASPTNFITRLLTGNASSGNTAVAAVIYALLAALCLTGVATLARYYGHSQSHHPFLVTFWRNIFAFIIILPFLKPALLKTKRLKLHLSRGIIGGCAMLLWFYSLKLLPLAEATSISFSSPLFATIGAALFVGEKVRRRRWTAIAIGFVGVLIMLRPGSAMLEVGAIYGLCGAVLMGTAVLLIHRLAQGEASLTMLFYMGLLMSIVSGIAASTVINPFTAAFYPSDMLLGGAIMGGLGVVGHLALNKAFSMADASMLMPLDFARLPMATVIGFAFFGEIPDLYTWLGGGLIISSSLYLVWREKQLPKQRTCEPATRPCGEFE